MRWVQALDGPLATAAHERRRQTPVIVLMTLVIGWTLHATGRTEMVWPWFTAAGSIIAFDLLALSAYARPRAGQPVSPWFLGPALLAVLAVSSLFSVIAVAIWCFGGRSEATIAVLILTSGLVSSMAAGVGSRTVFLLASLPYLLGMVTVPLAAAVAPMAPLRSQLAGGNAELPILATLSLLAMVGIFGVWSRLHKSLKAETAALVEAQVRLDQAQVAMADRATMAAIVSHELRTPVSAILAGAQMIQSGSRPDQTADTAELIVDAGRLMTGMLNDLLDHSKMEARAMSVEVRDFDLAAVVAETLRFWATPAQEKGLTLTRPTCNGDPVWLKGDPHRLRQILNNLMSNAIKFTAAGEVALDGDLGDLVEGRRRFTLTVRDNGPGVPPDAMERLFTPFAQGSAEVARTYGGTGLGLKVSRDLARLMGGDLCVRNTEHGAAFTLTLELAVGQPAESVGPELTALPTTQRRLQILAVDDHELNRRTLGVVLQPLEVDLTTACDGLSALELLAGQTFDLVLMDVNMPGIDGNEATRRLRASEGSNASLPVIGLSAGTEAAQIEACMAAGMTDWLAKPLEPQKLYLAIERAMQSQAVTVDDRQQAA